MAQNETSTLARPVECLPEYADARARRSLASKFSDAFNLSSGAAACLANAVVDPSSVRKTIGDPDDPNAERISVPGGQILGLRTVVWARKIMPDPRNPRTLPARKHPFAIDPGAGREDSKFRPLPEPRVPNAALPTIAELAVTIENHHHLNWACDMAKTYVRANNDWRSSIEAHGVMEAVWLAATTYDHSDGTDPVWCPTSVEGSSRTTAVHDILDVRSADVAYENADSKLRGHIKRLNEAYRSGKLDPKGESIMRCECIPALIVVAFEQHENSTAEFPTAIRSLVALRHVDPPKPWGEGPENEALADEVLDELERRRLINPTQHAYYAGSLTKDEAREARLSDDPVRRAAEIVGLLTKKDAMFKDAIRAAVTSQSTRKNINRNLLNNLATALILRGMDDEPRRLDRIRRYLRKGFGQTVHATDWTPTGRSRREIRKAALDEHHDMIGKAAAGATTVELATRAAVPLIASGVLSGDLGTRDNQQPDRRTPAEVIEAMRQTPQGIHQLARALHDYRKGNPILAVDEEGSVIQHGDGDQLLNDTYLRSEFPPPGKAKSRRSGETPSDRLHNAIQDLAQAFEDLERKFDVVRNVTGDDGDPLVETRGVSNRDAESWRGICRKIDEELLIWSRKFWRLNGVDTGGSQTDRMDASSDAD